MMVEAISRYVRRRGSRASAAALAVFVLLPASAAASDWASRRHAARELDRGKARSARHRGGAPRLEPATHVHQLGDHRPADPSGRAALDRRRGVGRRAACQTDRSLAGRQLCQLPRVSLLPRLPVARGRVLRRLPAAAARLSRCRRSGHDDHRVRRAELVRNRAHGTAGARSGRVERGAGGAYRRRDDVGDQGRWNGGRRPVRVG
jgi:hypothetical protein